jgi:hypothetical protein
MAILRTHSATTAQLDDAVRLGGNGSFVAIQSATGVAANSDGAGDGFTPVAERAGVSGVSLNQLVADGNLELT